MIRKMGCLLTALMLMVGCAAAQGLGELPQRGLSLPVTQADRTAGLELLSYVQELPRGVKPVAGAGMAYMSPLGAQAYKKMLKAYQEGQAEEFAAQEAEYMRHVYIFWRLFLVQTPEQQATLENLSGLTFENLGEHSGYTYLLAAQAPVAAQGDDAGELEALYHRSMEIIRNAAFQPVTLTQEDVLALEGIEGAELFPAFTTQDLEGKTVDNSIFAGKDLTVVNIWGTFCGPCISEMPELGRWAREMPENVQLIGIIADVPEGDEAGAQTARDLRDATGAGFTQLLASKSLNALLSNVVYVPTTIFVDGEGRIVGDAIGGAHVAKYKAFVEEYFK